MLEDVTSRPGRPGRPQDVEREPFEVLVQRHGATVLRVETDSYGAYEAHLITQAGQPVTVEVGRDFTVTGTEEGHGDRGGSHRFPNGGGRQAA